MPRLLAIIPEDGWAMVRADDTIFFVRPPFRSAERIPVPEVALADAVSLHGYQVQRDAPEESWSSTIARIRDLMARVHEHESLPSDGELLARVLRSGPVSLLTGLLDRIDSQWLATGDLRAAERGLKALFAEDRVKTTKELLERALRLRVRLDELREEREDRAPARSLPPRIASVSTRPAVASYRSRLMGFGSASMVSAGA